MDERVPNLRAGAPQYLIRQQLGEGGMGVVHLGTMITPAGRRPVAIKRLLKKRTGDPDANARIVAEAQLVFQLTHGNICQVLDLAETEDGTFIVMEFIDGLDLRTLLSDLDRKGQSLDVGSAIHIAREIARGLDYAHRRTSDSGRHLWLVHGDVTPQNILLSREGEVKLADFGIARALGTLAPGNQLRGGTQGYMAPEAHAGAMVDQRTDVYSLGVTLYVALGGKSPERGIDLAALEAHERRATPELLAIVERATATRPDDRFSTAGELEEALSSPLGKIVPPFALSTLRRVVRDGSSQKSVAASSSETATTLVSIRSSVESVVGASSERAPSEHEPALGPRQTNPAPRTRALVRRSRRRRLAWASGAVGLLAVLAALWTAMPRTRRVSDASPVRALAPTPVVTPSAEVAAPEVASPAEPTRSRVSPHPITARPRPTTSKAAVHKIAASAPEAGEGFLTVNAYPWGAVFVDDKRVANQTPLYKAPVPTGTHRVKVFNPDRNASSPTRVVQVHAGVTTVVGFDW